MGHGQKGGEVEVEVKVSYSTRKETKLRTRLMWSLGTRLRTKFLPRLNKFKYRKVQEKGKVGGGEVEHWPCQKKRKKRMRTRRTLHCHGHPTRGHSFLFVTAHRDLVFYYFIYTVFTARSAAPQNALWGGSGPRFEPRMGNPEAGTKGGKVTNFPPTQLNTFVFIR